MHAPALCARARARRGTFHPRSPSRQRRRVGRETARQEPSSVFVLGGDAGACDPSCAASCALDPLLPGTQGQGRGPAYRGKWGGDSSIPSLDGHLLRDPIYFISLRLPTPTFSGHTGVRGPEAQLGNTKSQLYPRHLWSTSVSEQHYLLSGDGVWRGDSSFTSRAAGS